MIPGHFAAVVLVLQLAILQMSDFRLFQISIVLVQLLFQLFLHRYRNPWEHRRVPVHFGDHVPTQLADRHGDAGFDFNLFLVLQIRLKPFPEVRRRLRVSNVQEA